MRLRPERAGLDPARRPDAVTATGPYDRRVGAVLTPVQQHTLDLLAKQGAPVVFESDVVADIRTRLDTGLAELTERFDHVVGESAEDGSKDLATPPRDLWVTKRDLHSVFTCEASWAAPDDFTWTPARAKGQVAHRAIQLLVHWRGEPVPATVVDEALARIADEDFGLAAWLAAIGEADRAELRSLAVENVTKFVECFPPLEGRWYPVTEGTVQYPRRGRIVLRAKPDLTLGIARGQESRKVIVDLKTGRLQTRHRDDLRYYALVETMARAVPPRLLASYSLDSGSADVETVTAEMLRSTLVRTLDGIERMVEITAEARQPERRASVVCRWCVLRADCDPGREFLAGGPGRLAGGPGRLADTGDPQ